MMKSLSCEGKATHQSLILLRAVEPGEHPCDQDAIGNDKHNFSNRCLFSILGKGNRHKSKFQCRNDGKRSWSSPVARSADIMRRFHSGAVVDQERHGDQIQNTPPQTDHQGTVANN